MKERKFNIDQEVEKTLTALDMLEPATPRPFFYTRLRAKMERRQHYTGATFLGSPAMNKLMLAFVAALVVINLVSVSQFTGTEPASAAVLADEGVAYVEGYYPETPTLSVLVDTINE